MATVRPPTSLKRTPADKTGGMMPRLRGAAQLRPGLRTAHAAPAPSLAPSHVRSLSATPSSSPAAPVFSAVVANTVFCRYNAPPSAAAMPGRQLVKPLHNKALSGCCSAVSALAHALHAAQGHLQR